MDGNHFAQKHRVGFGHRIPGRAGRTAHAGVGKFGRHEQNRQKYGEADGCRRDGEIAALRSQ